VILAFHAIVMGKTIRRWMFYMHHVIIFCTAVYTGVILGDCFTVYYRDSKNPILIFAYISLLFMPGIPLLRSYLKKKIRVHLYIFIIINSAWIILTALFVTLVYLNVSE